MAIKSKARHDLTLRSIKREIAAGRDVAYWLDKTYTHLDNGLLSEADIGEIEVLAQAYMMRWTRKARRKRLTTAFQSSKEAKP